jgi:hypothetical protein
MLAREIFHTRATRAITASQGGRAYLAHRLDRPAVLKPLQRGMLGRGTIKRSTAISNKSNATIATMGIEIGKNSFHIVGLDRRGAIVLRQKW